MGISYEKGTSCRKKKPTRVLENCPMMKNGEKKKGYVKILHAMQLPEGSPQFKREFVWSKQEKLLPNLPFTPP